ncbi:sodium-coupled monocarboxylate transporter 1-like isoform X1 [Wyeomyia smithii]|uniref:sodium-coupled monocarboxylate transporter 1-like isoform X1 n=1 Tax=Wyeomyia smithii TaxID=174621 RepID=UPI002467FD15|nr:sodium-coupled monocarboxylate transporter 1-like isoform X1 [Wyeomyia smithii]
MLDGSYSVYQFCNVFLQRQLEESTVNNLWNYLVFVAFVVISALIPIRKRLCSRKVKTKEDYAFGAGRISMLAMMLSITRGTLGVISVLGYPSEFFYHGTAMWETLYGMVTAYPIVCMVFIPVYFDLGITSVYQYLELRFNSRLVRCLASGTYIMRSLFSLGITIYTPTVALNTIIGVPYWVSLMCITCISIFFNALGGMKAAVAADVIQSLSMTAMLVGIVIYCTIATGGMGRMFEIAAENDRINLFNFAADLHLRVTTTSAWLSELFTSLSLLGCQQNFVQRYLSMPTLCKIRKTMLVNIPLVVILFSLPWLVGVGIYALYYTCDPWKAGYTEKMDQILPYFIVDYFANVPGVWGLFVGTLFNGALTFNISSLNSLAIVTWEDFLSIIPGLKSRKDGFQLTVIKVVGSVYAVIIMGIGFLVGLLSGVIEMSVLVLSATSGPLLGVFILAMFVPFANWKGAALGMILSHAVTIWIVTGRLLYVEVNDSLLSTSIEGCERQFVLSYNVTSYVLTDELRPSSTSLEESLLYRIYSVSYMYYSVFGTILTVSVGIVFSLATWSKLDEYNTKMLHPAVRWIHSRSPFGGKRFGSFDLNKKVKPHSVTVSTVSAERIHVKS